MPPLRILSYNVRYFGHGLKGLASTGSAMKRIAETIATLDPLPDLICLQEVETDSLRSTIAHKKGHPQETQLERLMGMFTSALVAAGKPDGYEAYYFPAHNYRISQKTSIYTTGLAILAHRDFAVDRHNAEAPEDITHRRIHAIRRLKQTRICAHLRFTHRSGHTIDVFNTHLSLPTTLSRAFWTGTSRMGWGPNQLMEARNLLRFIERERQSDRFVVVGDFNSLPGSPVYRCLTEEGGLRDPFAELHRLSAEELCHWPTAGFMNLRMHLDHVFSGPDLHWIDFEGSLPFGQRIASFYGLSDHVPLIGRCRVGDK
jgi:endonuclease/exonuclease/phosphatase family metal-dependent hydrolase